jgi:hypothetical protein
MVDDDLSDTAELELMDTDVMEQLPDAAVETAVTYDGLAGSDAPTDQPKEQGSKPGFDPYNHS